MIIQSRVSYIWKLICGLFDWFIYSFGILLFIKRSIHRLCPMGPTRTQSGPQTLAFRPPPSSFNKSSTRYCIMHVHTGITCMSCAIAVHSVMSILLNHVICIKKAWELYSNLLVLKSKHKLYFNEFDQWWPELWEEFWIKTSIYLRFCDLTARI